MIISVFTFHRAYNQGAVLQAYALSRFITSLGHTVVFPDANAIGVDIAHFPGISINWSSPIEIIKSIVWYLGSELLNFGYEDLRRFRFKKFVKSNLKALSQDKVRELDIDCAIYGSDQIWNNKLTNSAALLFLGKDDFRIHSRISYAASIGDRSVDNVFQDTICTAVRTFDAISVREALPFSIFDKHGRSPTTVLDPTLLLARADYEAVAHRKRIDSRKYLFVYLALPCPEALSLARYVASHFGLKVICVDVIQHGLWRKPKELTLTCSPDRFLAYIRDAEFVITNSFHGTAISLVYGKQFLTIPATGADKIPHRISSLLSKLNLIDRTSSYHKDDYDNAIATLQKPLPVNLGEKMNELADHSKEWLRNALSSIQR